MITVTVGMLVLLISLIPAFLLLSEANSATTLYQVKVTAQEYASSIADEIVGLKSTYAPPGSYTSTHHTEIAATPYTWYLNTVSEVTGKPAASPTWPKCPYATETQSTCATPLPASGANRFPSKKIGSYTYRSSVVGGWCEQVAKKKSGVIVGIWGNPNSGTGVLFNSTHPEFAYLIAVKVFWGGTTTRHMGHVVQYTQLSPNVAKNSTTWTFPTKSDFATFHAFGECPTNMS